ncbi:2-C-methyl-D-erythritol 4-phosphate cytidylyltransferase [Streptomyces sp. UP1A-1]|nr:2-C-methyl-D-erythritol 4-phosphate cytidylyltransferase [Streptomyces sp. UP1A-1]
MGGTPMLVHAVRAMAASRRVSLVVVVAPPDGAAEVKSLLDAHALPEWTDFLVVPGGETRQESVRLGLDALPDAYDIVLVHDAARPLVPVDTVDAVIDAVRDGAAGRGAGCCRSPTRSSRSSPLRWRASRSRWWRRRSGRGCGRCRRRRASTGGRWCGPTGR